MPDFAPQSVLQEPAAFDQFRAACRGGLVGEGRVGHGVRGALDPVRLEGSQVEATVCDSGCGISEEAEQTLFVPFVSTKPTGTGIGLNICRSFVELHQGRLWFSRNPERGTTFHVGLPCAD